MYEVTDETLFTAFKPMDIVSDKRGNVGMIKEVSVNNCQESFDAQISYAITWLTGTESKVAWFSHAELKRHCNLMIKVAENMCHPMGSSSYKVETLFKHM